METRFLTFAYPIADLGVHPVDICLWDYAANADKRFVFEDPEYMPFHFLLGQTEKMSGVLNGVGEYIPQISGN